MWRVVFVFFLSFHMSPWHFVDRLQPFVIIQFSQCNFTLKQGGKCAWLWTIKLRHRGQSTWYVKRDRVKVLQCVVCKTEAAEWPSLSAFMTIHLWHQLPVRRLWLVAHFHTPISSKLLSKIYLVTCCYTSVDAAPNGIFFFLHWFFYGPGLT